MSSTPDASTSENVLEQFHARCAALASPRVLELGTKRTAPTESTRRDRWVPHASEYLGTDIEAGDDVNVVADVHRLTAVTGEERFDVIISCSTFEHFKYPQLAAHEVMKALAIGGLLFVQTHQTFPLHSYPYDYFRFSREALAALFGTRMGMHVVAVDYHFPAKISAPREPTIGEYPAFLNVLLFGEKTAKTPQDYVYEFDT
jgi:hypothetical protein